MSDVYVFQPSRRWGVVFHLVAILVLGAAGVAGLGMAARATIGPVFLLFLLPGLAAVTFIPALAYRLYALQNAAYTLERDGVRLRWGLRIEDIPIEDILWVHPATELAGSLPLPRLRWPGAVLGRRRFSTAEEIEFLASSSQGLILIATPGRGFAISPADQEGFLLAFQRCIEMGSLAPRQARSVYPTFLLSRVWASRAARAQLLAGFVLGLLLLVWVSLAIPGRSQVFLGFRIDGQPFRIIGVLASKGGSAMGSQDNRVLVPFTTAQSRLMKGRTADSVNIIFVQATSAETTTQAAEEISQILRTRHRTAVGADDFTVFSQADMLSTASSITGILTVFLGGIAAISLLVGGIGIMNIMLVSVTERTREIGLRKALGARKRDILIQFLAESSLLSLLGGVIGILLGWLISVVIYQVSVRMGTPFEPSISVNAITLATVFSAAVGLFFGIYPANRAASLQPVEALRYE